MKLAMTSLTFTLVLAFLISHGEISNAQAQKAGTPRAALSPDRAKVVARSLGGWTLKSGEEPGAGRLVRDCIGASAAIMNEGSTGGVNQTAMEGLGFWSAVLGAVVTKELKNGGNSETDEDTAYRRQLKNQRGNANDRVPYFIRDYFAECETIRKRFR